MEGDMEKLSALMDGELAPDDIPRETFRLQFRRDLRVEHHDAFAARQRRRLVRVGGDELQFVLAFLQFDPAGHNDAVHDARQAFEHALAPTLRAAVERITARTVVSFLPTTHLTPSLTLLTFAFGVSQPHA